MLIAKVHMKSAWAYEASSYLEQKKSLARAPSWTPSPYVTIASSLAASQALRPSVVTKWTRYRSKGV